MAGGRQTLEPLPVETPDGTFHDAGGLNTAVSQVRWAWASSSREIWVDSSVARPREFQIPSRISERCRNRSQDCSTEILGVSAEDIFQLGPRAKSGPCKGGA